MEFGKVQHVARQFELEVILSRPVGHWYTVCGVKNESLLLQLSLTKKEQIFVRKKITEFLAHFFSSKQIYGHGENIYINQIKKNNNNKYNLLYKCLIKRNVRPSYTIVDQNFFFK